jgi:hypothetical protein
VEAQVGEGVLASSSAGLRALCGACEARLELAGRRPPSDLP